MIAAPFKGCGCCYLLFLLEQMRPRLEPVHRPRRGGTSCGHDGGAAATYSVSASRRRVRWPSSGASCNPRRPTAGPRQAQSRWPPRNKRRPTSRHRPRISTSSLPPPARPRPRPDPRRRMRTWPATVRRVCSSEPPRPPGLPARRLTRRGPAQTRPCCSCRESRPRSMNRAPVRHSWTSCSARMGRRTSWTAPPASRPWGTNGLEPPLMPTRPRWWPRPSRLLRPKPSNARPEPPRRPDPRPNAPRPRRTEPRPPWAHSQRSRMR